MSILFGQSCDAVFQNERRISIRRQGHSLRALKRDWSAFRDNALSCSDGKGLFVKRFEAAREKDFNTKMVSR